MAMISADTSKLIANIHPLPHHHEFKKKTFENIVGKREKGAFSPFPTMFSADPKTKFSFWFAIFVVCKCFPVGEVKKKVC